VRPDRWFICGVPDETPHGGPLRARHLFADLAARTEALQMPHFGGRFLPAALLAWRGRAGRLASTQLISQPVLRLIATRLEPVALDLHDDPIAHLEALGLPPSAVRRRALERLVTANLAAFRWTVVQSARFADLADVPPERRITIPNGTDTRHIAVAPLPDEPVVATLSGAAPGRGLELLVDAVGLLRQAVPEARLRLALVTTGAASRAYLGRLRADVRGRAWVEIVEVPYPDLAAFLAGARVVALPHPAHRYWDAILPIKLFDGMASGRPLVTTPRTETANLLLREGAGLVAGGDRPEDLAQALRAVLADDRLAADLGARGRAAAVARYDWRVLSARLTAALLDPERGQA
jgi:glycosyltransferase involved in cell wall biosynthesis